MTVSKVHRSGVAYTAAEARRRRKRPCATAPATPANVRIDFKKREEHHKRVFNAHVKWDAVTEDAASRPITPEQYQVQLQATDASGEAIETQDQDEALNAFGRDFSLVSGAAVTAGRAIALGATGVIEHTLTGLTAGLGARVDFWMRKSSTGSVVNIEIWNSTDSTSVKSKHATPSKTVKPDVVGSLGFVPATGKTYKARLTWVSGSGAALLDQIQWRTDGDTATWTKNVHYPDVDASFAEIARPDGWYYAARVRVMNRVPGGKCWSDWSDWTDATQPITGEPSGPPPPDGINLSFDKVEGMQPTPWRARVGWDELGTFVSPDGDAQDGARSYIVQLAVSNDGGTHTTNVRRHVTPAEPDQTVLHADFFHLHGKRTYRARVRSQDKHGILGAWSDWTSGWHGPNGAPSPVTGLTWDNPSPAHLVASWDAPTDLTDVYQYHVQVIHSGTVKDDGYTAGTRWRYDIPKADRALNHHVKVTAIETSPTLDADSDDGAGGSTTWDTPDAATDVTSSDVTNTATWDESDITIVAQPISDGVPPATQPTPTVIGGPGYIAVNWDAVSNIDPVDYDVYVDTTNHGSTASAWEATTPVGSIAGTLFFAKTLASGTALAYGTTYYVTAIARDTDGASTAAVTVVSTSLVKVGTTDIAANAVTAAQIAANTITTLQLDADAIDGMVITGSTLIGSGVEAGGMTVGALFTTKNLWTAAPDDGFAYNTIGVYGSKWDTASGTLATFTSVGDTSAPTYVTGAKPTALNIAWPAAASRARAVINGNGYGVLRDGVTYTLSLAVKSISGSTSPLTFKVYAGSSAGVLNSMLATKTVTPTTSWQRISLTFVSPLSQDVFADASNALTFLTIDGPGATASTRLHGMQLEIGNTATAYNSNAAGEFLSLDRATGTITWGDFSAGQADGGKFQIDGVNRLIFAQPPAGGSAQALGISLTSGTYARFLNGYVNSDEGYTVGAQALGWGRLLSFTAGAAPAATGIAATETTIYTAAQIGSATIVSGRRYRLRVRGIMSASATAATGQLSLRVRLGTLTGSILVNVAIPTTTTGLQAFDVSTDLVGGTDITTGSQTFVVTNFGNATSHATVAWTSGQVFTNLQLSLDDVGV